MNTAVETISFQTEQTGNLEPAVQVADVIGPVAVTCVLKEGCGQWPPCSTTCAGEFFPGDNEPATAATSLPTAETLEQ